VIGHAGGFLEGSAVRQLRRDARGPETVVADFWLEARGFSTAFDHAVGIRLREEGAG